MSTKKSISRIFSVLFIFVFMLTLTFGTLDVTPAQAAGISYVTPGGTGDCSSWANACTLQTALTYAVIDDEIWVVAGTYKPTTGTNRNVTFQLKSGVALYGGFAGAETERGQRNPTTNLTILSGDIDNDDSQTPIITNLTIVTGNTTNSYHVVTGATGATLDGFTITAGNANDTSGSNGGGGLYNNASNPMLTNVTFSGNSAVYGGGMYNKNSDPMLTNVTFSGNSAQEGGGMINFAGSNPILTNVTFSGNLATSWGGGMSNMLSSNPTLTNVTFSGNLATSCGGGMENYADSSPTLTNVTFSGNSADRGGGMYNVNSSPTIRNTIFWGNTSQIYNYDTASSPVVSDSVVQGGYAGGTNIITTDAKLGTLGDYGGLTQTVPLLAGSSAIDTGNDSFCPATDQRGVARPQGSQCDIGAYELDTTAPMVNSITRLDPTPTNLTSVNFTVAFSESVTGVNGSEFSLTTAGVSGASVTGVSGSDSVYTVTVNTGSGNGTIRLDISDSATITDLAGNLLSNLPYTGDEIYTVYEVHTLFLPLILR